MENIEPAVQFYNFSYTEDVDSVTTIVTRLHVNDYLGKAFDILPSNANIDKGRCGIGGTTLEIEAKRHSIFIVCTTGGIKDKAAADSSIFPIHGKMKPKDIESELMKESGYRKLFVTPDSFWKIIQAAKDTIGLEKLRSEYFVLYDEAHTVITESWRPNVLAPLKEVWKFKNKSFITATPCEFNDPNFMTLQNYKIEFHEPHLGTVNIVSCATHEISACVDAHIANASNYPGNLFFFYNSVTEITETIVHNKITDCHIYCAPKGDNYDKLSDQLEVFRHAPETDNYAKINFFTTRYFECFDLWSTNATIILVTDTNKPNTRVGISNKGVQAVGRIRNKASENELAPTIIHITNDRGMNTRTTRDQFKQQYKLHQTIIPYYNAYVDDCHSNNIVPLVSFREPINGFTDIDEKSNKAYFSQNKLDQVINELVCNEEFNHLDYIIEAWKRSKYDVSVILHRNIPELDVKRRLSKANRFMNIINLIHDLETNRHGYRMGVAAKKLQEIQSESHLAFEAYYTLGIDRIDELSYKETAIRNELVKVNNEAARIKLMPLLANEFIIGQEYTNEYIIERLQYLYKVVGLKNVKNPDEIQKAYLSDLEKNVWYKLKHRKIEVNGKEVNGRMFEIQLFSLECASSARFDD